MELLKSPIFWLFGMIMVMAGASEQAMSQWASAFAESGLHISKFAGDLAGPCIFSILMGLSRTWYGKCGERVSLLKFMLGSAVLCVGSYLLAAFASIPALALVGCGICGLSVGIFWPGAFSLASKHLPRGGMAMFALLALFGDLGCSSGPTVVGMVAGAFQDNLKKGLFAAILFPIGMILCGLILAVYARNRSKAL